MILNIVFSSVLDHVCRQLAVTSEFSLLQFCQLAPLATYCVLTLLILTAFLVRPLQEGHGCITSKMIKYSY